MEHTNPLNSTESHDPEQSSRDRLKSDYDSMSPNVLGAAQLLARWMLETITDTQPAGETDDVA